MSSRFRFLTALGNRSELPVSNRGLLGSRWSLMVARELCMGQLRFVAGELHFKNSINVREPNRNEFKKRLLETDPRMIIQHQ